MDLRLDLSALGEEVVTEKFDGVFGAVQGCGLHGRFDEGKNVFLEVLVCGEAVFGKRRGRGLCESLYLFDGLFVGSLVFGVNAH